MQANNILTAHFLDIIFDNRNKAYGAYDLRKNYHKRLFKSLSGMFLIVVLLLAANFLFGFKKNTTGRLDVGPFILIDPVIDYPPQDIKPKIKIIPPAQPAAPKLKTLMSTTPLIVDEKDVPENEKPPTQEEQEAARIGTTNTDGKENDGLISGPANDGKGIVEIPKEENGENTVFYKVEIESEYPGGVRAWAAFLNRYLAYPNAAAEKEIQGTVIIQFIVDAMGNVSDVAAISGPEELQAAAIAVIKKSGQWTPAIQNGRKVKSYKKQPVTFRLASTD